MHKFEIFKIMIFSYKIYLYFWKLSLRKKLPYFKELKKLSFRFWQKRWISAAQRMKKRWKRAQAGWTRQTRKVCHWLIPEFRIINFSIIIHSTKEQQNRHISSHWTVLVYTRRRSRDSHILSRVLAGRRQKLRSLVQHPQFRRIHRESTSRFRKRLCHILKGRNASIKTSTSSLQECKKSIMIRSNGTMSIQEIFIG